MTNATELQNAILNANSTPETISFSNNITLTTSLPPITNTYTIQGNGFDLDGGGTFRGFIILNETANPTVTNINIKNVVAQGGSGGKLWRRNRRRWRGRSWSWRSPIYWEWGKSYAFCSHL